MGLGLEACFEGGAATVAINGLPGEVPGRGRKRERYAGKSTCDHHLRYFYSPRETVPCLGSASVARKRSAGIALISRRGVERLPTRARIEHSLQFQIYESPCEDGKDTHTE